MNFVYVALGELIASSRTTINPSKYQNEVFELFSIPAYDTGIPEIVTGSAIGSSKQLVEPGDVLLSRIVPHIRRSWVIPTSNGKRMVASGEWIVFRNQRAQPRYLRHVLLSDDFHRQFMQTVSGVGGSLLRARTSYVAEIQIPLPTRAEQDRIASILDAADALRAKRRETLTRVDELKRAVFFDMFGDPASNDRQWPTRNLGDMVTIRRGGSPRPIENFLGGTINWIKIGDATGGSDIYIDNCKDKITEEGLNKTVFLQAGSLIFANCGVSLGFARILRVDGCIHDGWLSLENIPEERLNKIFLLKALNAMTPHFRRIAPNGTQPNLNTGIMKACRMILPPVESQRRFAAALTTADELLAKNGLAATSLDNLFGSLQHHAFRGEL